MLFPVDLSLLQDVSHMPALPVLERSMNRPDLHLHDFCIPVNPYFPSPELIADLQSRLEQILRYYPSDNFTISEVLGEMLGIDPANLVMANGSTELITWINERLITGSLMTDVPTFGRWTDNARELGQVVHPYYRLEENDFRIHVADLAQQVRQTQARSLAICNPNNPTGALLRRHELVQLLEQTRELDVVVIDESFIDFAAEETIPTVAGDVLRFENAILIKSLGKNFGLHGLRCGYAVTNPKLADQLRRMLPPWNVNSLAEEFIRLMAEHYLSYEAGRRRVVRDSRAFARRLCGIDALTVYPTHANFVFCKLTPEVPGVQLRNFLLEHFGLFVRECGSKLGSSSQFFRIATRPEDQQELLIDALHEAVVVLQNTRRIGVPG